MPKFKIAFTYSVFLLIQACSSGSSTSEGSMTPPGQLPGSARSAYNPSDVWEKIPLEQNLIPDGTFESNVSSDWQFCGSASVKNSTEAAQGSNSLLLSSSGTKCSEGIGFFSDGINAVASTAINLDYSPDQLYVSFYIKASANIANVFAIPFEIKLHDGTADQDLSENIFGVGFLNLHDELINEDWTKIRYKLDNNEFNGLVENGIPQRLSIFFSFADPVDVEIDDLRLTVSREVTQAELMPAALLNNPGDQQLVFTNNTDSGISTMLANGSELVTHNNLNNDLIVSAPVWYSDTQITYGLTTFSNPISNGSLIAAAQSELFLHDLSTGQTSIIFETTGSPGLYNFDADPNNTDALDVRVRRVSWDNERSLGAISICANLRSFAFVGDDLCLMNIVDSNANFLHDVEIKGYDTAFSVNGQLAYVKPATFDTPAAINVIDDPINNPESVRTVYESNTNSGETIDWSPNGQSIIFLERAGDVLPTGSYAESIKELNVNTGAVKELLLVDHGDIYASLSWGDNGYIVYSLFIPTEEDTSVGYNQIWWLDPNTGKTGPITTALNAFGGKFQ